LRRAEEEEAAHVTKPQEAQQEICIMTWQNS